LRAFLLALLVGQAACSPDPVLNPTPDKEESAPAPPSSIEQKPAPNPQMIEIFLEAARSDIKSPYDRGDKLAARHYRKAAIALLGSTGPTNPSEPEQIVAEVLARSNDLRAAHALIEWATRPTTQSRDRAVALEMMASKPRADYLPVVHKVLADPSLAGIIAGGPSANAFNEAVGTRNAQTSVHVLALEVASRIGNKASRTLLREIAMDRSRRGPDPLTLKSFHCPKGRINAREAQGLADLRIMAFAMLGDLELMRKVSADPSERPLVRDWTREMIRAKTQPSKGVPRSATAPELSAYVSPCLLPIAFKPPDGRSPSP